MLFPGAALRVIVVKLRNEPIQRVGKSGFRSPGRFEFAPKLTELRRLILWKKPEDAVGSPAFFLDLVSLSIINVGIAGIDLDDVVDEDHPDDFGDIERLVGVFGKCQGEKGKMPAMLGGVFVTSTVYQIGSAIDALEPVDFQNEPELLL